MEQTRGLGSSSDSSFGHKVVNADPIFRTHLEVTSADQGGGGESIC
jgi:hypothetical protein